MFYVPRCDTMPFASFLCNSICEGDMCNTAKRLSPAPLQVLIQFLFQCVNLSATRTETAHFNKEFNAKELLGEQSVKLSDLKSEENFYSCEICKKSFLS
jgi:hypothetical protein